MKRFMVGADRGFCCPNASMIGSMRAILFARWTRTSMRSIWPNSGSKAWRRKYGPALLSSLGIAEALHLRLNRVQSSRRRRVVQIPDVQADREYHFLALRFERAATPGCTLIHPRRTLRGAAT